MFEEFLAVLGRPWLIAAAAIAAVAGTKTGRKWTRDVVKSAARAGYRMQDGLKDATSRVQEEFSDVMAEAKAELSQNHSDGNAGAQPVAKKKSIPKRKRNGSDLIAGPAFRAAGSAHAT